MHPGTKTNLKITLVMLPIILLGPPLHKRCSGGEASEVDGSIELEEPLEGGAPDAAPSRKPAARNEAPEAPSEPTEGRR